MGMSSTGVENVNSYDGLRDEIVSCKVREFST